MMKAQITVPDESGTLSTVFEAELKTTVNDRASYVLTHDAGMTTFSAKAKDIVALRATLNAIFKQLVVFEKMKSIE